MNKKIIGGALAGAVMLANSAAALADVPATAADSADPTPSVQGVQKQTDGLVTVANAQGTFSFDQSTTTPNETIRDVFQKSRAALCNSVEVTEGFYKEFLISVGGSVPNPYSATLGEVAEQQGTTTQVMGCSCTSNSIGGWAIANARVKGVSVAALAAQAGL